MKDYKINVSGDFDYISGKDLTLVIRLRLWNGHYTIQSDENRKMYNPWFRSNQNAQVYTYTKNLKDRTVLLYDGKKEKTITLSEFYKMEKDKENYILIVPDAIHCLSPKQLFECKVKERDELLKASKGQIDLFRYRSMHDCVLDTFRNFSKAVPEPEAMTPEECVYIENGFCGALMGADAYEGEIYTYDMNSMYPFVETCRTFQFPFKQGSFAKLSEDDFRNLKYYKYGIYRCEIDYDSSCKMLFRYNSRNYYTHYDLTRAKELGLKISIVCDGQANALLYKKEDLISGDKVFSGYVNLLYPLKKAGCKPAKQMLNLLWGTLSQKNTRTKTVSQNKRSDREDSEAIINIHRSGNDIDSEYNTFTFVNTEVKYKTNFGRLGAFLTSYCRMTMSRKVEPFRTQIKRIHTDGFSITRELNKDELDIGKELGQFKLETEKTGKFKIKNVREMEKI